MKTWAWIALALAAGAVYVRHTRRSLGVDAIDELVDRGIEQARRVNDAIWGDDTVRQVRQSAAASSSSSSSGGCGCGGA
jgi:hypothetical protein